MAALFASLPSIAHKRPLVRVDPRALAPTDSKETEAVVLDLIGPLRPIEARSALSD
jgi:hypothetical protein